MKSSRIENDPVTESKSLLEDRAHGKVLLPAILQGVYYILTGVWPLVNITSFQVVTGPSTDLWLVRANGILVLMIGICLAVASFRKRIPVEILILAVGSAIGIATVEIIHVALARISAAFLLDAALEVGLAALWLRGWFTTKPAVTFPPTEK